jgi:2-polyprenyl-3-methyl-5-hydroxy-6-metoxy-1,4-benzoquinol methylase
VEIGTTALEELVIKLQFEGSLTMSKPYDKSWYDEHYFQTSFGGVPYYRESFGGHYLRFFATIAQYIYHHYKPSNVLDVGCAKGFLVEGLRDLGVDACGFDVSEVAISEVREDIQPYCVVGSVDDPKMYEGFYDFVSCIEVLEHVSEDMALKSIEFMCNHTNIILFSSTPSDFDEPTHINVQPPEYWDNAFAKNGFIRTRDHWQAHVVAPHTVIYRKYR